MSSIHLGIDFEQWAELAQKDPDAFEKCRAQLLAIALNRIPTTRRHKFECLQWRIDSIRYKTKTPLFACMKISQLMWSSFDELQRTCNRVNSNVSLLTKKQKSATVISFRAQPKSES